MSYAYNAFSAESLDLTGIEAAYIAHSQYCYGGALHRGNGPVGFPSALELIVSISVQVSYKFKGKCQHVFADCKTVGAAGVAENRALSHNAA